jgi:hypothetical protein
MSLAMHLSSGSETLEGSLNEKGATNPEPQDPEKTPYP